MKFVLFLFAISSVCLLSEGVLDSSPTSTTTTIGASASATASATKSSKPNSMRRPMIPHHDQYSNNGYYGSPVYFAYPYRHHSVGYGYRYGGHPYYHHYGYPFYHRATIGAGISGGGFTASGSFGGSDGADGED